jgi:hypothetical protein
MNCNADALVKGGLLSKATQLNSLCCISSYFGVWPCDVLRYRRRNIQRAGATSAKPIGMDTLFHNCVMASFLLATPDPSTPEWLEFLERTVQYTATDNPAQTRGYIYTGSGQTGSGYEELISSVQQISYYVAWRAGFRTTTHKRTFEIGSFVGSLFGLALPDEWTTSTPPPLTFRFPADLDPIVDSFGDLISDVIDSDTRVSHYVGILRDITSVRTTQELESLIARLFPLIEIVQFSTDPGEPEHLV